MPFHIKNSETDALARRLAERRRIGLTEAVHQALDEALARDAAKAPLPEVAAAFCRDLKRRAEAARGAAVRLADEPDAS